MLTSTMIQNIEQTASEFAQGNVTLEGIEAQAKFQLDNEYFDFELTDDDKDCYIEAYIRGAKSANSQ